MKINVALVVLGLFCSVLLVSNHRVLGGLSCSDIVVPVSKSDSLKLFLDNYVHRDTVRVAALLELARSLQNTNTLEAKSAASEAYQLLSEIQIPNELLITTLKINGIVCWQLSDYREAMKFYDEYLAQSRMANDNYGIADAYSKIARVYRFLGDNDIAHRYYMMSLQPDQEKALDKTLKLTINLGIGWIYADLSDFENSKKFFTNALALSDEIEDELEKAKVYNAFGAFHRRKGELAQALNYHKASLKIKIEKNNLPGQAISLHNTGRVYTDLKDYRKALESFHEAAMIKRQLGNRAGLVRTLNGMSDVYKIQGRYTKALDILNESMSIAQQIQAKHLKLNCLEKLVAVNRAMNDFQAASDNQVDFINLKDSLFSQTKTLAIGRMESEHNLVKSLKENELLQYHRALEVLKRNILLIVAVFTFLLLVVVFYYLKTRLKMSKRLVDKERKYNKMKSDFFAEISHKQRTPLALISGKLEELLNDESLEKPEFLRVQQIFSYVQELSTLTNAITDLSNLEQGTLKLQPKPVRLWQVVNLCFSNFISMAEHKQINYHLEFLLDKEIWVSLDFERFCTMLNNLIINAIKFTNENGEVLVLIDQTISTRQLKIVIKDSGRGIPTADLDHVFDSYSRSGLLADDIDQSIGMGLNLVQRLVKACGGQIEVNSKVDIGSTFTLILPMEVLPVVSDDQFESGIKDMNPASRQIEGAPPKRNKHMTVSGKLQSQNILIVEDNETMRSYLVDILEPYYVLHKAANGRLALELLEKNETTYDLIISDIMMPEMDGFELLEKIKNSDQWADISMIMLTGRPDREDKLRALTTGVDDYLIKPFSTRELIARCKNLLNNAKRRSRYRRLTVDKSADQIQEYKVTSHDKNWLRKVELLIIREINNSQYNLSQLAQELQISERTIQRKIRLITGMNTSAFVREIKLERARAILESGEYGSIAEVCYSIGLDSPGYFSKIFKQRFGHNPTEYLKV